MIHEIGLNRMNIDYKNRPATQNDYVVLIEGRDIVIAEVTSDSDSVFPRYADVLKTADVDADDLKYLFTVDEEVYYLYSGEKTSELTGGYQRIGRRVLYDTYEEKVGFIGYTAAHVRDWLTTNKFCGRCGDEMTGRHTERALVCPTCELVRYPQISPVVIVLIHNGDHVLLTKYAHAEYERYALVAGFVEIGEELEAAVRREVMEEVGLKVKNIRYYGSQPWGITGGLMAGFFAELDGDPTVELDTDELKEGSWLTKEEMPTVYENEKSLTRTMMHAWFVDKTV